MTSTSRTINHTYAPSHNWTCISRPDDPQKTLVNESGAMLYDFLNWISGTDNYYFKRVFSFGLQSAVQPACITQTTESALYPFVNTIIKYPHATLELTSFSHTHDDQRTDIVLWTIRAEQTVDTVLWVDGQSLGDVFVLPDTITPHTHIYRTSTHHWSQAVAGLRGSTPRAMPPDSQPAYVSTPFALEIAPTQHYGPTPRYRTPILTVSPDAPVEGALMFPIGHDLSGHYDLAWARHALDVERRFWAGYPLQPLTWQMPDDDVMDMVTASARNIMQARDVTDGLPEFQVGPTCYRGLWVVDGHFILEAARYLGHASATEQGINALLRRVREDGSIAQLPHHIKETGISIATFVRLCELDGDWARLETLWPVIQRAVAHIQSLREASKLRGKDAPEYNLMPPAFGDGGLGGHRAEYTTALWTLVGLKQAARAAHLLGYKADAADYQDRLDDMLAVFYEKAARDVRHLPDGTPYLPMAMPDGSGQHRDDADFNGEISPYMRLKPGTATWALAHAIYPGEVFAPDDLIVLNFCQLLDQLDGEEGIPAETGWLPHNGLWTYAASFYAHVWLYAGRPDKAIDYLYSFANHASTTRVWREEQSLRSATYEQIIGDMPHNWASAEFIRLTRSLLVFEKGQELHILPALPPEWIKPNATIRLQDTPTRYGPVDMTLAFDSDANAELTLAFDTERSLKPDAIILHIPDNMQLTQSERKPTPTYAEKCSLAYVQKQAVHLSRL